MRNFMILAAVAACAVASPAMAQVTVTHLESGAGPSTSDGTTFTSNPADNRLNNDGTMSSATISATSPISANGSIELDGRRSRVYNDMTGFSIESTSLTSLTADYLVTNGSPDGIQSPAFRVTILGGEVVHGFGGVSELIWEAANNGGYTLGVADTVGANDLFWRQIVGTGYDGTGGLSSGGYVLHTLADWGDLLGGIVYGIGVGNGGCPGDCSDFNAYADNLALTAGNTTRSYDFAATSTAAVPEPATWAMMLIGFGGVGFQMRRQRRKNGFLAQAA
jgi:hypothetical protein